MAQTRRNRALWREFLSASSSEKLGTYTAWSTATWEEEKAEKSHNFKWAGWREHPLNKMKQEADKSTMLVSGCHLPSPLNTRGHPALGVVPDPWWLIGCYPTCTYIVRFLINHSMQFMHMCNSWLMFTSMSGVEPPENVPFTVVSATELGKILLCLLLVMLAAWPMFQLHLGGLKQSPTKLPLIWPQETQIIHVCGFKLLSFGNICYVVDNKYINCIFF